jgi:hypothetical protein
MTDWMPRLTTCVFVADRVVIWNIMSGSLCIRRMSFSTKTFLFFIMRYSERMAIGTYESQKNVAIATKRSGTHILSSNELKEKREMAAFLGGHL